MNEEKNSKLTDLCNLKTIQEEGRGFFISLVENVRANTRLKEWTEDLWKKPIYGEEFIQLLIKETDIFNGILETFTVTEVYRKKCEKTAGKILLEAAKLWTCEQWLQCREKCSQAILRSPLKSDSSRGSHVLQKALLLRARCLCKEEKISLARVDLHVALQQGQLHESSKEDLKEIFKELKKYSNDVNTNENNIKDCNSSEIHLSGGQHHNLPGASKLLTVSENLEQGRFISAAEDVKVGDILIMEKPYAACLKPKHFGTHCHHCFEKLEIPFGCTECVAVAFCSEKCYKEAATTYHQYECKFMDLFIGSGMSILCHIALRMVTQIGLKETLNIHKKYFKQTKMNQNDLIIQDKEEFVDPLQHSAVYKLVTHEQRRQPEDYLNRTLMALFLTRCLQKSNFFNNESPPLEKSQTNNDLDSDVVSVWSVLLFNLQVLQFNAHQVCGLRGEKELGCALYATASLFNHDCCPSVIRYFLGKQLVVVALRPVMAGEAVGDSYGPQWGRSLPGADGSVGDGVRRSALHSRYWFTCKCRPCSQLWPLPPPDFPGFKCPDRACDGIIEEKVISENENCNLCQKIVDVDYIQQKHDALKQCFEKLKEAEEIENKEEKFQVLQNALMEYGELSPQPCVLSLRAEDAARSCYATILHKSSHF